MTKDKEIKKKRSICYSSLRAGAASQIPTLTTGSRGTGEPRSPTCLKGCNIPLPAVFPVSAQGQFLQESCSTSLHPPSWQTPKGSEKAVGLALALWHRWAGLDSAAKGFPAVCVSRNSDATRTTVPHPRSFECSTVHFQVVISSKHSSNPILWLPLFDA